MERSKRRALSQRIGLEGEKLFELWAINRNLTTNKVEEDLGIDYFCQVLRPVADGASEESTGRVMGVQVKATENESSPRITLTRLDAIDLLNQTQCTCIIGLHLPTRSVRFRFIDQREIDSLLAFLRSQAQTLSIPFKDMDSDDHVFQRTMAYLTRPGTQHRLRIRLIRARVRASIPDAELRVMQTDVGGISELNVPWLDSVFEVDPKHRQDVHVRVFERGELPIGIPGVMVKSAVLSASELADGPLLLMGKSKGSRKITVRHEGKHSSATFQLRVLAEEAAFIHPGGLRITFGKRREDPVRGWVHDLECGVFLSVRKLRLSESFLSFLRLMKPGAQLSIVPGDLCPVEELGLENLGFAIDGVRKLSEALDISFEDFQLGNLKDEEFAQTLEFLHVFLLYAAPLDALFTGFIIGPMARLDPRDVVTKSCNLTLPIVMNWKETAVILWINCQATAFLDDNAICGFSIERQVDWRVQKEPKRLQKSIYPEVWIKKGWPAVRIGVDKPGLFCWSLEKASHVLFEAAFADGP